jgi:hypothetical protein
MLVEDEVICWQVTVMHQSWCCRYSGANCEESKLYCNRASAVAGTVVPSVKEISGTAS